MKNEKLRQSFFSKKTSTKGYSSLWWIVVACSLLMMSVFFISCVYENEPGIIYPAMVIDTTGMPRITDITPSVTNGGAIGGIREIKIIGTNLGLRNGDTNWIYFGGVHPIIKDIQNSSITIYRPKLSNDNYNKSIDVNVTDPKLSIKSSNFQYMVESPGVVVGDYSAFNSELRAIDFDNQGNLYALFAAKTLLKNDFAGVSTFTALTSANLLQAEYASTSFCTCDSCQSNVGLDLWFSTSFRNASKIDNGGVKNPPVHV